MSKSCNSFSRGDKNLKAEMLRKGVYVWRAKPMRSAQPEAQRCDWLTAWKFQNNDALWKRVCGWKPPRAWSVLCHHDHGSDPVKSWVTTNVHNEWKQFRVNGGTSVNSFNLNWNISDQIFAFERSKKSWFSTELSTTCKYTLHSAMFVGFSLSPRLVRLVCWLVFTF